MLEKGNKYKLKPPTRSEIQAHEAKRVKDLLKAHEEKNKEEVEEIDVDQEYINPNYGKLNQKNVIEASGINDALQEMTLEEYDKHPEKRMRQAWEAFFEKQLPLYKAGYPNLKRSQYIQMISKEFKTSPENPVYASQMQKAKKAQEEEEEEDKKE